MKKIILSLVFLTAFTALFMSCSEEIDMQAIEKNSEAEVNSSQPESAIANTNAAQPFPLINFFMLITGPVFKQGVIDNTLNEIIVTMDDGTDITHLLDKYFSQAAPVPPTNYTLIMSPYGVVQNYETEQLYTVFYSPSSPSPGNIFTSRTYTVYVVFSNDFLIKPLTNFPSVSLGENFIINGNFGGDLSEYSVELLNTGTGLKTDIKPSSKYHNQLIILIPNEKYMGEELGRYKVSVTRKGKRKVAEGQLIISNN